jgi:nucleotide-binding universal stress UspA family protein
MTENWNIVVGIDGSDKDQQSTLWAGQTAARSGGRVHVVYAAKIAAHGARLPEDDIAEVGRAVTEPAAEQIRSRFEGVEVTTEVVMDDPAVALVSASRDADLVVVGARGLGRVSAQFLGSVSQKVAAQAACPVVVAHEEPKNPDGDVTVGVDPGDPIPEVIDLAFRLAKQRGVGVRMIYAFTPPPSELGYLRIRNLLADAHRERAQELRKFAEAWQERYPDVPTTINEAHGQPAEVLMNAIPEAGIIVLGSRGRMGLSGRHLGSVAQRVLHHAPLAVVVPVRA